MILDGRLAVRVVPVGAHGSSGQIVIELLTCTRTRHAVTVDPV